LRGSLLAQLSRPVEAEEELRTAVSLDPCDVTWAALSDFYRDHGRAPEAIQSMQRAAALSTMPYSYQSRLGYLYLSANQPRDALRAFDKAEAIAPKGLHAAEYGTFDVMLARGRSVAWNQLGDLTRAISFQQKAAELNAAAAAEQKQQR